ncbi:uncharacterized protein LOC134832454 [Culicoides brevitarsis]|uniref:uncharacterized protein LOC134832454 n=1 Tax=Culicoides brevitarsis TaxID=469753 RepID=UPI00307BCD6F
MQFDSKYLTKEEKLFVQSTLEDSLELRCTTVAQVYTTDPIMKKTWTHVSTGVLFIAKNDVNGYTLGLFHLLRWMIEWEEEVYQEMTLKYEKDRIITLEGKRRVFLLNFLCDKECRQFLKVFNEIHDKICENEYEPIEEYPENEYEPINEVPETPKKEKRNNFFAFLSRNKEKQESKNEKRKKLISSPKTETFQHTAHAGFNANGLVIEGVGIDIFQNLIKQAGITPNEYNQNKEFIDKFVDTHKNKINTEYKKMPEMDEEPKKSITKFASELNLNVNLELSDKFRTPSKPIVQKKPSILPKPKNLHRLSSIQERPVSQKVIEKPNLSIKTSIDSQNDLLAAIRSGTKLRPVRQNIPSLSPALVNKDLGIADALRLAVDAKISTLNPKNEDEETYFPPDEWE